MKRFTQTIVLMFILAFTAESVQAQEAETPTLVVNSQKVKMTDIAKVSDMVKEKFSPILNGLVDEGKLYSWGIFTHAWGDEWNFNIWYVVKDMNAFNAFWAEYMNRISEHSEAWEEMLGHLQEHKDNIYNITYQYPVSER